MCYRTGKYTICRRVRAFFSPEVLQAGAVKGLSEFGFLSCLLSECLMSGTGLVHCMFWDKTRLEMNVVSES